MKRATLFLIYIGIALTASAQSYEAWCNRAITATEQDSLPQAEIYIQKALKADPANPHNAMLFSNLGTIQRRQGRREEALESYTLALNIAPHIVSILMNRATLYMELGKEEPARIDYSLALDMDAENQEALLMRAYIYMRQREYKFARADYDKLLRLNPTHYSGRMGLILLNQKEGKPEAALKILNETIEGKDAITPPLSTQEVALLYVMRADIERQQEQPDAALLDLEEALRLDGELADAYLMRGQIYLEQKKKTLAKRELEKAAELGIPQAEIRELLKQCK